MSEGSQPFTVLVADDDIDDREMIDAALSGINRQVRIVTVDNGLRVIDFLLRRHDFREEKVRPDMILLDLNMPLMDGFDVLNEIKKHRQLLDIPVYVITVSRDRSNSRRALELGATGFYSKGLSTADLARMVHEVCGRFTGNQD